MGDALPTRVQRFGAYAVVRRDTEILLTRMSDKGFPRGAWTLPGGGIDHGEDPLDTVRRELWEETGLRATTIRLVDVFSSHVIGDGREGAVEDYHGVAMLYAVDVEPGEPQVMETDGSTDAAAWVAVDDVVDLPTSPMVAAVISDPSF